MSTKVVERQGDVRRAKLNYLRGRIGKAAMLVKEKDFRSGNQLDHFEEWKSKGFREAQLSPFPCPKKTGKAKVL